MKFKIHVDGAEHQVEAGPDGKLVVDGQTFEAKIGRPADDRRNVQVGAKTYEIRIVEDCADTGIAVLELAGERVPVSVTEVAKGAPATVAGTAGMVTVGGTTVVAAPAAEATAARNGAGAKTPELPEEVKDGIWAPVPGKIVEVFVKAGDVVEEGTVVLVLEAMKMENELHAPHKGTVAAVLVKRGDQADKGQLLVAFV